MHFKKPTVEVKKEDKASSPAKKAKPAAASAASGGADVKEIVFSFDTTGSMYPCLTQVTKNYLSRELCLVKLWLSPKYSNFVQGTKFWNLIG